MKTDGQQRVAIITGWRGGLGEAVTRTFLDAGMRVAGIARGISSKNPKNTGILEVPADLLDSSSVGSAINKVLEKFARLDILVHLVGGFEGGKTIVETEDAALTRMLDLNLRAAFNIFRIVIPHMRTHGYGRVVAVGSRIVGEPQARTGVYGASKAALVSLVRTLALENADKGITANIVLPTTIDTPANRIAMPGADTSKWVHPDQVAQVILWLASDAASQTSGALIPIYGRDL